MAKLYVQTNTFYQAGSGNIVGATTDTLTNLTDIYANTLTMANFGDKGYCSAEPDTNNEEGFTFTGITANTNGTFTLTGVQSILAVSPYTESGTGMVRQHAGGTKVVVTDNVAFWSTFANKYNNEVITSNWTVPNQLVAGSSFIGTQADIAAAISGGVGTATTTTFGTVKMSTAPAAPGNPIAVGDNDPRVPTVAQGQALAGTVGTPSGTNKYVTNNDTSGTGAVVRSSLLSSYVANAQSFTAGAAITAGQALHLTQYSQSDGGIQLDTRATSGYANVTNRTIPITIGNHSNRILLISVLTNVAMVTAPTYNGVTMTIVTSQAPASFGYTQYVYKLVAPTVGTANLVVTGTALQGVSYQSWYNVDQTANVEAFGKAAAATVNASATVTTVTSGARIAFFSENYYSTGTYSSGVSTYTSPYSKVSTGNMEFDTSGITILATGDSYTDPFYVPGSSTVTVTSTVSVSNNECNIVAVALAPATTTSTFSVVPASSALATSNEPLIKFIGFADASAAQGAPVATIISGVVTGLTGLTAGKKYYLQDTAGTIGLTPGGYAKIIGIALSSTTLLIAPEKTMGAIITKSLAYTYTAECDGYLTGTASAGGSITVNGYVVTTAVSGEGVSTPALVTIASGATYLISGSGNTSSIGFIPLA
jgi:hypothetical protein